MFHTGLVSVTFRKLAPREIVDLVAKAKLDAIEWGGDIHVPHGDLQRAREVARMTTDAGLRVSSYGSYYRMQWPENKGTFQDVVATALELKAPTIRIWPGARGSAEADAEYRRALVNETRQVAEIAQGAGLTVAFEFHSHSLTDTYASAQLLLKEVAHPALRLYWQPMVDPSVEENLKGLGDLLPKVTHIHVFYWAKRGADLERRSLAEGKTDWTRYLKTIAGSGRDHYVLLEFVKDDAPEAFIRDAEALKGLVGKAH